METNCIYQYSLLNALMSGVCEDGITASALLEKSCNQGLGTFSRLDGELVLLDGHIYRLCGNGQVREASGADRIPFAMAVNFMPQQERSNVSLHGKSDLETMLGQLCGQMKNLFVAYRLDGTFRSLKIRSVVGQQYREQPLAEMERTQAVESYADVRGTVIGFRSPEN